MGSEHRGSGRRGAEDSPRRRPTIHDVAVAAGVSRTTVSHALSGSGRVDPSTRERVLRVVHEIGYRPNARARALRRGRSRVLAVASSMHPAVAGGSAHLGFFMEIAAAAAERCFEHGYALVLVPPVAPGQVMTVADQALDGVLVVEPTAADPVVAALRAEQLPFVTVGRAPDAADEDLVVDLDVDRTADLMLGHLRERGCRQVLLVVGDQDRGSYRAAYRTWRSIAPRAGWGIEPVVAGESGGEDAGRDAVREALAAHPDLDGVAAWVDAFALGAVRAALDAGRRVPEDVCVLTRYDGLRARTSEPRLTAVDLGLAARTHRAVDLLLDRLDATAGDAAPEGRRPPDPSVALPPVLPPARLVTRRSTQR